jgi:hypothetical protein
MVQHFPEDGTAKCTLFDEASPADGMAKCFPVPSQPVRMKPALSERGIDMSSNQKRARISTQPVKGPPSTEYFVTICFSGDGPASIKSCDCLEPYKEHIVGGAFARFLDYIGRPSLPRRVGTSVG